MNEVVFIEDVCKSYGQQCVLSHVNLHCTPGKIYGLVGRNGSGKTVLLKSICGLTQIDSGSLQVWGKEVGREIDFPDNLGLIIESPGFLPHASALKNLSALASIRGKASEASVKLAIEAVGLNPSDRKPVGKYSLGMRQRLGLAQAIMEDPDLLILDEPMNGLDRHGVDDIRTLLLGLKSKGKTIILASHFKEDISLLCDEVYEMDAGILRKAEIPREP